MPLDNTNFSTTSLQILDALNLMQRQGWCRYIRKEFGAYCAIGAINQITMNDCWANSEISQSAIIRLSNAVPKDFHTPNYESYTSIARVATYNNTRKDFSEIKEWFEKAIEG